MFCQNCSGKNYAKLNLDFTQLKTYPLMVIGESPTVSEIKKEEVMTGSGAQILKETMVKIGLPIDTNTTYFTTALKCAVPKKKGQKIPPDVPVNCRQNLIAEIRAVKPQLVLVCGAVAMQTLTGNSKLKISEEYGRVREYAFLPETKIIPIMNPGALMHNPGDYKPFLTMLQLAATIYHKNEVNNVAETKWTILNTKKAVYELWQKMHILAATKKLDYAAYDIETTGLDYRTAEFLVMGICFEKGHTYIIPRECKQYLHNFLEGIKWKIIWHHGKFDKKILWKLGLGNAPIDEDTIYQHYVLDESSEHNLGYLSKIYLNAAEYKYKMDQNWKSITLEVYPQYFEALCERAAFDCDHILQLFEKLSDILNKQENQGLKELYYHLLIPGANLLSRIEQNGIPIDISFLEELNQKYITLLDELRVEIQMLASSFWDNQLYMHQTNAKSAPIMFNPGSPSQMAWMVFDRLKIRPRIKRGRSTDKDILKSIDNPPLLIKKVLEYRTLQKEHSTYVLGILEAADIDEKVRTTFTLHVTVTGRLSSKEPNVQNQPSVNSIGNIRKAFIAPPTRILAEVDYVGAELRWLAYFSQCPILLDIFMQDRNLHNETAKALFGENYNKQQKMRAKAVNFGIAYGREALSLSEEFNIPFDEAQQMVEGWLNKYPGAKKYLQWCAEQVTQGNYLESPWKRRRRFGLVTPVSLHSLQNEAKNFPISSSSSDTLLKAALLMEKPLWEKWNTLILNLVHDSALLSIPGIHDKIWEVALYTDKIMSAIPKDLFNCNVPFKTDFEIGLSWGEMVPFDRNTGKIKLEVEGEIQLQDFHEWYVKSIADRVIEQEIRKSQYNC